MNRGDLKKKVRKTAGQLVHDKGYVSPVDLLMAMDRLDPKSYEDWRRGRIPYLEKVCNGNLSKLSIIIRELAAFALDSGLKPSFVAYKKWGKGKKIQLRFSKSGHPNIEKAYATHYLTKSFNK